MERIFSIDGNIIGSEEVTEFTSLTYSINRIQNGVQTLQREDSLGQNGVSSIWLWIARKYLSQGNLSSRTLFLEDGTEISFSYLYDATNNLIQKPLRTLGLARHHANCQGSSSIVQTTKAKIQQPLGHINMTTNKELKVLTTMLRPSDTPHHKDYFSPDYNK